jgi:hypothetical protein
MNEEIIRFAFPAHYKYIQKRNPEQAPNGNDELSCKEALTKDFKEPIEPKLKRRIDQSLKWADAYGLLDIDLTEDDNGGEQ